METTEKPLSRQCARALVSAASHLDMAEKLWNHPSETFQNRAQMHLELADSAADLSRQWHEMECAGAIAVGPNPLLQEVA